MNYKYEIVKYNDKYPARILLQNKPGYRCNTGLHWHKALEFIYVLDGTLLAKINNHIYEINHNELGFVNSEVIHESISYDDKEKVNFLVVLLSYEFLKEFNPNIDSGYFKIDKDSSVESKVKTFLKEISELMYNKNNLYELKIKSILSDMAYLLLNNAWVKNRNNLIDSTKSSFIYVKQAIEYMELHYTENITLAEISSHVGLTSTYFSKYFSDITKKSFKSHLNYIRLEHALKDILNKNISVTEAAYKNGFPNVKSLINLCKSIYNLTPTQYKKKML